MKNILLLFLGLLLLSPVLSYSQIVETIVGNGTAGYSGDNGPAVNAELNSPQSVRFDRSGNMYIVDNSNNVIRMVDLSGIITTVVGRGIAGYSGDNGPATNAEISSPNDIAFDAVGNLYIADWGNEVIRKVTVSGIITTFAGGGSSGLGDGGLAIDAELNDPLGLVFDSVGDLYISDNYEHRVRKINTAGIITTVAGNGISGFNGDGGMADSAEIRLPEFISLSPSGNLYISDCFNHRIREVVNDTINTAAGNGTIWYTNGGLADTSSLEFPWSIVFDDTGNYFISDLYNGTIHEVDNAGIINTIAGNGTSGYAGDGGVAIAAEFGEYSGCTAIDPLGNLYIADNQNNRIRRIIYTPTNSYTSVNNVTHPSAQIIIYPNPATKEINISTTAPFTSIVIQNTVGQTVYANSFSSTKAVINVESFPAGVYFVKINETAVRKFVKE